MERPSIALIGGMGVGKSTILRELVERHGYRQMSWATPLKELAALAYGGEVDKNRLYDTSYGPRTGRDILQRIGTDALRDQVDQDFWVKAGIGYMRNEGQMGTMLSPQFNSTIWVNDDTRFVNEADALYNEGFRIVRLLVPETVRAFRLDISVDELRARSQHPSELELADYEADLDIENDGTRTPEAVAADILDALQ